MGVGISYENRLVNMQAIDGRSFFRTERNQRPTLHMFIDLSVLDRRNAFLDVSLMREGRSELSKRMLRTLTTTFLDRVKSGGFRNKEK